MPHRVQHAMTARPAWMTGGWLILALVLGGCTPAAPPPEPPTSTPAEPDPASEDEMAEYLMTLDLGTINFPTSASDAAQRYFVQGVAALHNFDYYDAGILFRAAQRVEPDFVMAYWGEAMTHTAVVWRRYPGGQQHRDKAIAVLERLGPTSEARAAKAPTEREKGFVAAVEALYLGEDDKRTRDFAHLAAMRALSERYPHDEEALGFYCVSRLSTERDQPGRRESAAVALELLVRNPEHPGAYRCLIHSADNSERGHLGMVAARRYPSAAPDTHAAYHMPSHIFIQLAQWARASETSERAIDLSRERLRIRGLAIAKVDDHQYGHLQDYLQYSLLQQGRFGDARALVDEVHADYETTEEAQAIRAKLASTSARYLVETEHWDETPALVELAASEGFDETASVLLAIGVGAVHTGDLTLARDVVARLERAGATVMRQQVSALIHVVEGNETEALRLLDHAATTTHATDLPLGPADPIKPVLELYGEVLLMLDRPVDALEQFEAALVRRPGRPASLLGAARASARTGDTAAAAVRYAALVDAWSAADADHPGLREAQEHDRPR